MGLCRWGGGGAPQSLLTGVESRRGGAGEGRGKRHFSRDRVPGRRPQSRAAGAAAAEAVAAATAASLRTVRFRACAWSPGEEAGRGKAGSAEASGACGG